MSETDTRWEPDAPGRWRLWRLDRSRARPAWVETIFTQKSETVPRLVRWSQLEAHPPKSGPKFEVG